MQERLQKILSRSGIASRRKAEDLIRSGQVSVNGVVVRALGTKADASCDRICVAGEPLAPSEQTFSYYAFYKPRGLLVSKADELGRATVFSKLQLPAAVNYVGRLDKESEGLLLLSDDGDFIFEYTHPSFGILKKYHVSLERALTQDEIAALGQGLQYRGEFLRAQSVQKKTGATKLVYEIVLAEGKKREIRKMMEYFDIQILRLVRVQHGTVRLGRLRPGELKQLSARPK